MKLPQSAPSGLGAEMGYPGLDFLTVTNNLI